ncbi:MAG: glucokinase [Sulfuriferula sp.]
MCAQDVSVKVLAGDIGGTHTRLARLQVAGRKVEILAQKTYSSPDYAGLDEIVAAFTRTHALHVDHACFGIAGPVVNNIAETTNLPWRVNARALASTFKLQTVTLLNDLEANAWGIPALDEADFYTLQGGASQADGHRAVVAAGTGLGEAGLFWDGHQHHPFASEGGHASFSPANALETALLTYLVARFGHVSWERVLSGPGLVNLHAFLLTHRRSTTPPWLNDEIRMGDSAAAIAQAALQERDDTCVEALALFVRLYGGEAGNLALKLMATGGVYLGGGIAPRILPALTNGGFIAAFLNKGRMRGLLETIPVRVILNDQAALFGAALCAADHARNSFPRKKENQHESLA